MGPFTCPKARVSLKTVLLSICYFLSTVTIGLFSEVKMLLWLLSTCKAILQTRWQRADGVLLHILVPRKGHYPVLKARTAAEWGRSLCLVTSLVLTAAFWPPETRLTKCARKPISSRVDKSFAWQTLMSDFCYTICPLVSRVSHQSLDDVWLRMALSFI